MFDVLLYGIDEWQYFLFYGFIAFTLSLSLCIVPPLANGLQRIATVWFTLVLIGIVEEYRQLFEPARTTEWFDALASTAGVSMGVIFPLLFHLAWRWKYRMAIRGKTLLSFTAAAFLVFAPLLSGLAAVTEPAPPIIERNHLVVAQDEPIAGTVLGQSATPDAIVQKYRTELRKLEQYAKKNIEQLAQNAWDKYREEQMPLHELLAMYTDKAEELERHINGEFEKVYEAAKQELEQQHFDPAYANALKTEYEDSKKALRAAIMQKAMTKLV